MEPLQEKWGFILLQHETVAAVVRAGIEKGAKKLIVQIGRGRSAGPFVERVGLVGFLCGREIVELSGRRTVRKTNCLEHATRDGHGLCTSETWSLRLVSGPGMSGICINATIPDMRFKLHGPVF